MSWRTTTLAVCAGLALLWLASLQTPRLAVERARGSITYASLHAEPLPPAVAFTTITLAGFRGLMADLLWLRAADLQDKGRYFELVQLADWITTLEPEFAEIWVLQAWNMAYNISVMMPQQEDRWRWVQNGITLLQDRGIRYCPADPLLYHELAWIFLHKIGSPLDPSGAFYKREWAMQMMAILGESAETDYAALKQDPQTLTQLSAIGLDPDRMRELNTQYGPLDWRVSETHALYWAHLGRFAAGRENPSPMCERLVYQAMAALFDHGKLTYSAEGDIFVLTPNFDLLPTILETFDEAMVGDGHQRHAAAYSTFLASAIGTLKFYHREPDARELFNILHTRFPSPATQRGFDSFARSTSPTFPQILSTPEEDTL